MRPRALFALLFVACSSEERAPTDDAAVVDAAEVGSDSAAADGSPDAKDASPTETAPPPAPCRTRVTYGSAWIHGADHPARFDDVDGVVTWDGTCVDEGANSYATLSNGWKPYFGGHGGCVLALDQSGSCPSAPKANCTTRVTYGAAWIHGPGHAAQHDEVAGPVGWGGACANTGSQSTATLTNGWTPYFSGSNACSMSFRYEQCGGLYENAVVPTDCPDPGVLEDGPRYVMACTGGGFPLRTSTDLVNWKNAGEIFPAGKAPKWAVSHFWAPEIHKVGTRYVAYFSAKYGADGSLAVGAATATDALGPYTDLGKPLVHDPSPGVIDAHEFTAPGGKHYLLWKVDGNAVGAKTPIRIQPLADDGVTLTGSPTTILTNDQSWEGGLVEGPWMIAHGGSFFLFYSANGYASTAYAIGVARASSPLGPFTKASGPIVGSNAWWSGPGHGSVIVGPRGDDVHVYHAWVAGKVGAPPGRGVLVDRITWGSDGWPHMSSAPTARSQPLP